MTEKLPNILLTLDDFDSVLTCDPADDALYLYCGPLVLTISLIELPALIDALTVMRDRIESAIGEVPPR